MDEWWNRLSLAQLDAAQWESLCDGCGKCCLHKLQDAHTGELYFTAVHCRYLDSDSCRCRNYGQRLELVEDCVSLGPGTLAGLDWLPPSCAYRLRGEGKPLPDWHPLVSGDPGSVHRAGKSVRGRVISEEFVHPDGYDDHIIRWVN